MTEPQGYTGSLTMRRRVYLLGCLMALIGCGSTAAAPLPDDPLVDAVTDAEVAAAAPLLAASSAVGADDLMQLLTAPVPVTLPPPPVDAPPPEPSGPPYKTGPRGESPVIIPPPAVGSGDGTVYAVGDSVLLGTEPYLATTLGGWNLRFDARVGRTVPEGLDLIHGNRASLGQAVIVLLGHNYWSGRQIYSYLDQMMTDLRAVERVVVVTVSEFSPSQVEVNKAIRALPRTYANVVVADWGAVAAANPEFLIADNVHLTRAGDVALANLVAIMLGPARPNGRTVPPLKILPIPNDPGSTSRSTTIPPPSTTTTPVPTTTTKPSTTTSPSSTTTTSANPTPSSSTTTTTTHGP